VIAKRVALREGGNSSFAALAAYISAAHGKAERVGAVAITNAEAETVDSAVALVVATQRANDRARGDKTYHLLLSFPAGETPDAATLRAIEARFCRELGFGDHQRISAIHHDTDNLHVHLAINKVHPVRLTCHSPSFDKRTLGETCAAVERDYGLAPTNHGTQRTSGEGRSRDMARAGGLEPLVDYARRTCPDLATSESWASVHAQLADAGLTLKSQGAGFVILDAGRLDGGRGAAGGPDGDRLGVKASTVARALSKAKLEARLGPFVAPDGDKGPSAGGYEKAPVRGTPATSGLYARYQQERATSKTARSAALAEAAATHKAAKGQARARYDRNRGLAGALAPDGGTRRALRSTQASFHRLEQARLAAERVRATARINAAAPTIGGWLEWLQKESLAGDAAALAALRARADKPSPASSISGEGGAAPIGPQADSVTKTGTIIYRTAQATVRDDGNRLHVSRGVQDAGVLAALKIAKDRHGGVLTVTGDAVFRARVARLAALSDPTIRFADPDIERQRGAFAAQLGDQDGRSERVRAGPGRDAGGDRRGAGGAAGTGGAGARRDVGRRVAPGDRRTDGARVGQPPAGPASKALAILRTGVSELGGGRDGQRENSARRLRLHDVPRGGLADGQGKAAMLLQGDEGRDVVDRRAPGHPDLHRQGAGDSRPLRGGGERSLTPTPQPAAPGATAGIVAQLPEDAADSRAAPSPPQSAAAAYAAERNAKRDAGLGILRHGLFREESQEVSFAGVRQLRGEFLALGKIGDEIAVISVSEAVHDRLKRLSQGTPITVIADGATHQVRPKARRR
jgi:hypothetical protein